jgi:hypothetical protein
MADDTMFEILYRVKLKPLGAVFSDPQVIHVETRVSEGPWTEPFGFDERVFLSAAQHVRGRVIALLNDTVDEQEEENP